MMTRAYVVSELAPKLSSIQAITQINYIFRNQSTPNER